MSFKLLAIRPLKGCSRKFLKNLQINCIYKFYECARFFSDGNVVDSYSKIFTYNLIDEIIFDDTEFLPVDFFYDDKISVSAIVGKNGSGKSSLIDLLVASINQLALKKKREQKLNTTAELKPLTGAEKICCDIFYKNKGDYFILTVRNEDVSLKNLITQRDVSIDEFFYTSIVNYSIHSNNSNEVGKWIDKLFHKNDSYQIPVVINPKRESFIKNMSGIIDINNENFLLNQRLLSLMIANPDFPISENLKVDKLLFKYKSSKHFTTISISDPKLSKRYSNEVIKKTEVQNYLRDDIGIAFTIGKRSDITEYYYNLASVLKKFKHEFGIEDISVGNEQYRFDIYIIYKITSISSKYHYFKDVQKITKAKNKNDYDRITLDFDLFLKKFKDSDSHIVIKLLQVVNYLKNYDLLWKNIMVRKRTSINLLSRQIQDSNISGGSLINKLPPPLFEAKPLTVQNIDILTSISSGEKQLVHSISSILYHLSNLNSVEDKEEGIIKYKSVNIVLDEIELYFHPEFQRCFLDRLLKGIINIDTTKIMGINILIISHSPFILSDIPKQNVLFLKSEESKSQPVKYYDDNTFAENIHEILSNGFFLEDTQGEFAKNKINNLLEFYFKAVETTDEDSPEFKNYQSAYLKNKKNYEKLIHLVGEDYVRTILQNHILELDRKFIDINQLVSEKKRIIEKLHKEIKLLENNG
ncbi:AAA family ATPase [Chryseobacterium scophthalmum]|uniref:AAA family ATPase n=1 Tax=Chryseobacterium scophthalmum TaxID=59733 RepID=UPI001AEC3C9B|nr:AAA family ATPase [Chryseobacterium scophthalmum]